MSFRAAFRSSGASFGAEMVKNCTLDCISVHYIGNYM